MNDIEKAYCKHDLNVLFGESVDTESHFPDELVSDYPYSNVKYSFNGSKKELTEYAKEMKSYRLFNKSDCPCDKFSSDGKILYTENLSHTINYFGFSKIAKLLESNDGIIFNDGFCKLAILFILIVMIFYLNVFL